MQLLIDFKLLDTCSPCCYATYIRCHGDLNEDQSHLSLYFNTAGTTESVFHISSVYL